MSEKSNLTLEDAIKEFPEEIKTVLGAEGEFVKDKWDNWRLKQGMEEYILLMECSVAYAALQWLEGRGQPLQHLDVDWRNPKPMSKEPDEYDEEHQRWTYATNVCVPKDPLRWLLEEVREQLKRE